MEKIPFINYPGTLATSIYDFIKANPCFSLIGWQTIAIIFILVLFIVNYFNFSEPLAPVSRVRKKAASPTMFIILVIVGIFILRIPNLILKEQNMDESQWIANAGTWLSGAILWKEVNGFTGGPLLYVPLSIMYYFGDGLNYTSIRLFGLLFCIIPTFVFVYLTFYKLLDKKYASLISVPLILFFSFSNSRDFIAYESELMPMLLTAISIFLFVSWYLKKTNLKYFLLGFILGCFPYAKLQAVPIAMSIVICSIIELIILKDKTVKQKIISLLIIISSGILPSVFMVIYLIQNSALLNFWNDYIIQNISYTQSGLAYHITGISKLFIPIIIAKETPEIFWFIASTTIALIVSVFIIFRNRNKIAKPIKKLYDYFFLIFIISYITVCFPGGIYFHYETLMVVPLIIFSGYFLSIALPFFQKKTNLKFSIIIYLTLSAALPLTFSIYNGNRGIDFVANGGNFEISSVAKEIQKYSMPNEKLSIWGWNHKFYVETGLTQGTSGANSFYEATYSLKANNSYLEKYIFELKHNRPVIFLDASKPNFIGFKNQVGLSHENFPMLNDYIIKNYTLVSEINQKKIYVLNERLIRMGLL